MSGLYTEWQVEQFEQDAHDGAILEAGKEWERQQNEFNSREHELESRIAELESIANELFEALTLTYNKLPEHWRKDYCPYDYHFLKVKLERAKERDE